MLIGIARLRTLVNSYGGDDLVNKIVAAERDAMETRTEVASIARERVRAKEVHDEEVVQAAAAYQARLGELDGELDDSQNKCDHNFNTNMWESPEGDQIKEGNCVICDYEYVPF